MPHRSLLAAAAFLAMAAPVVAGAQATPAPEPAPPAAAPAPPPPPRPAVERGEDECLGFAFGRWTPALDARAAGHGTLPPPGTLPQAPSGRDWAAAIESGRDTTLMLFPSWWPAGVHVTVPAKRRSAADTVRGTAVALVADGRVRAPTTEVRMWLVPCRR